MQNLKSLLFLPFSHWVFWRFNEGVPRGSRRDNQCSNVITQLHLIAQFARMSMKICRGHDNQESAEEYMTEEFEAIRATSFCLRRTSSGGVCWKVGVSRRHRTVLMRVGVLGLSLGGSTGLPTFCKLRTDTDPTPNRIHQNIANLMLPTI